MESQTAPPTAAKAEPVDLVMEETLKSKADLLYEKCSEAPPDTTFFQRELANMQVAEDTATLISLLEQLCASHLMKSLTWDNQVCWKLRTKEEAGRLRALSPEERSIYLEIDEVQSTGIWTRTIRTKTGLPQNVVTKALKALESRGYVKSVNNIKFPSRKMYLLSHLRPSEETAGGPWHAEGNFDIGLIEGIGRAVMRYVESESWVKPEKSRKNTKGFAAAIEKKKAQVQAGGDIEDTPKVRHFDKNRLLPQDPSFKNYPTCGSILAYINTSGFLKNIEITERDLEELLEMLVLDGRLERMAGATGYRTVKGARDIGGEDTGFANGFNDAPCGKCPVFELCGDGGAINAKSCRYFDEWLGREV